MRGPDGRRPGSRGSRGRDPSRREMVTGHGAPGPDGARVPPKEMRVLSVVCVELRMAIASLELVSEQLHHKNSPWTTVQVSLFRERVNAMICELEEISVQAAKTSERNPE